MSRKSTQIAIGGVFSAMCLALMFLTGMIPFATYFLPALAGAMLIAVVVENGRRTALLVYISVSALSLFIVPDREAALLFILFLGYYPIIKEPMERLRPKPLQYLLKLVLFNITAVGGLWAAATLLGMAEVLAGMEDFGKYAALIFIGGANLVFLFYDYVLTAYTHLYVKWFKPTFLRR